MSLSPSAQRVQNALAERGFDFRVLELPSSTRTAVEAAETIGCTVAQIVKSLVFRTRETQRPVLVLASGVNRVNEKKLAARVGEKLEKADAGFVRDVTGFAIGGIPPVGHAQAVDTYIDEDLLRFEELWAAAGTPNAVFCLTSEQLVSLTAGQVTTVR